MPSCSEKPNTPALQMRTFGAFSLSWNGKRIDAFSRASASQDMVLLQLVLHHRRDGISREALLETLFSNRELQDVSHSLQVLLYNIKAKLRKAGLPPVNYIYNRGGVFFWSEEVPVEEDAATFETLCRTAADQADEDDRLRLLREACALYTGEFLYLQSDQFWVNQEARRYEALFDRCVTEGARLLRQKHDWKNLLLLGDQAAKAQPFFGWEALSMEALIAMGRSEAAIRLYRQAERQYGTEMRLAPDEKMTLLLEQATARNALPLQRLDRIALSLLDEASREGGGLLCTYPVFRHICRMACLSGKQVVLLGCGLGEDRPPRSPQEERETMVRLCNALQKALPETAVMTPYGERQFLALLFDIPQEERQRITARVDEDLSKTDLTARLDWASVELNEMLP